MKTKLTPEQKEAINLQKKIEAKKSQKQVEFIEISIEWKKSKLYGFNPHLSARIKHTDSTFSYFDSKCSGYGYDKESTVIADLFNNFLSYALYNIDINDNNLPYGISKGQNTEYRYYCGGIGTNCYYRISQFIGGEFKRVGTGKSFDCYNFKFI